MKKYSLWQRVLSLVLSVSMIAGIIPVSSLRVFAADEYSDIRIVETSDEESSEEVSAVLTEVQAEEEELIVPENSQSEPAAEEETSEVSSETETEPVLTQEEETKTEEVTAETTSSEDEEAVQEEETELETETYEGIPADAVAYVTVNGHSSYINLADLMNLGMYLDSSSKVTIKLLDYLDLGYDNTLQFYNCGDLTIDLNKYGIVGGIGTNNYGVLMIDGGRTTIKNGTITNYAEGQPYEYTVVVSNGELNLAKDAVILYNTQNCGILANYSTVNCAGRIYTYTTGVHLVGSTFNMTGGAIYILPSSVSSMVCGIYAERGSQNGVTVPSVVNVTGGRIGVESGVGTVAGIYNDNSTVKFGGKAELFVGIYDYDDSTKTLVTGIYEVGSNAGEGTEISGGIIDVQITEYFEKNATVCDVFVKSGRLNITGGLLQVDGSPAVGYDIDQFGVFAEGTYSSPASLGISGGTINIFAEGRGGSGNTIADVLMDSYCDTVISGGKLEIQHTGEGDSLYGIYAYSDTDNIKASGGNVVIKADRPVLSNGIYIRNRGTDVSLSKMNIDISFNGTTSGKRTSAIHVEGGDSLQVDGCTINIKANQNNEFQYYRLFMTEAVRADCKNVTVSDCKITTSGNTGTYVIDIEPYGISEPCNILLENNTITMKFDKSLEGYNCGYSSDAYGVYLNGNSASGKISTDIKGGSITISGPAYAWGINTDDVYSFDMTGTKIDITAIEDAYGVLSKGSNEGEYSYKDNTINIKDKGKNYMGILEGLNFRSLGRLDVYLENNTVTVKSTDKTARTVAAVTTTDSAYTTYVVKGGKYTSSGTAALYWTSTNSSFILSGGVSFTGADMPIALSSTNYSAYYVQSESIYKLNGKTYYSFADVMNAYSTFPNGRPGNKALTVSTSDDMYIEIIPIFDTEYPFLEVNVFNDPFVGSVVYLYEVYQNGEYNPSLTKMGNYPNYSLYDLIENEVFGENVVLVTAVSQSPETGLYCTATAEYVYIGGKPVTFDMNGGNLDGYSDWSYLVKYGEVLPYDFNGYGVPERTGYKFAGWSVDPSAEEVYDKAFTDDSISKVYAVWIPLGLEVDYEHDKEWTGSRIKPWLRVTYNGVELKEGKDYTVSYKNNTKVYVDPLDPSFITPNAPTITVTGKGAYKGTKTVNFNIYPKVLTSSDIEINGSKYYLEDQIYTYTGINPIKSVKYNGKTLKYGVDYKFIDQYGNEYSKFDQDCTTFRIDFMGNYCSVVTTHGLKVVDKSTNILASDISVTIPDQEPGATLYESVIACKYGTKSITSLFVLVYNTYDDSTPGTATARVSISGSVDGKTIVGTKIATYKVKAKDLSKCKIVFTDLTSDVYNGHNRETIPFYEVYDSANNKLIEGTDYIPEGMFGVSGADKAGTATIILKGCGKYTGTLKKTYKIRQVDLAKAYRAPTASNTPNGKLIAEISNVTYSKAGRVPEINLTYYSENYEYELPDNWITYKVSYKNNTKAGIGTATITGTGSFKGSITLKYTIDKQDIRNIDFSAADVVYSKTANKYQAKLTLTDNGKALVAGTDYSKTIVYRDSTGRQLGAKDAPKAGSLITVTVTGMGSYTGTVSRTYRIVQKNISSVSVSVLPKEYTGKAIVLGYSDITVKAGKQPLIMSSDGDYVIVGYKNNVNVGTATVYIKGVGNYGGIKACTFKINPRVITVI